MNKYVAVSLTALLAAAIIYMVTHRSAPTVSENETPNSSMSTIAPSENVNVRDGVQYITVSARGGYSPATTIAKGGMPTKLVMKTNGTYDCSSSLVVKSAGFRGMLPATGETPIDLATPKSGEKINASCGMGMYSFAVYFK